MYGQPPAPQYGQYGQQPQQYQPPAPAGYGAPAAPGGYQPPAAPGYGAPPPQDQVAQYFAAVDRDRSGRISAAELQQALSNGHWQPFSMEAIAMMIKMFDRENTGEINLQDFYSLWKFINDWKACFQQNDFDRSGHISQQELETCVRSLGYSFSPRFFAFVVPRFSKKGPGSVPGRIYFDDFVLLMCMLRSCTDVYRQYDTAQRAVIECPYEQFVVMAVQAFH